MSYTDYTDIYTEVIYNHSEYESGKKITLPLFDLTNTYNDEEVTVEDMLDGVILSPLEGIEQLGLEVADENPDALEGLFWVGLKGTDGHYYVKMVLNISQGPMKEGSPTFYVKALWAQEG